MLGKFAISIYIGQSDVGSTYRAAGSLVILLLWTYYSSIILYLGAEFTRDYCKLAATCCYGTRGILFVYVFNAKSMGRLTAKPVLVRKT